MPSIDIPISGVAPSGRAVTAGPSRSIQRDIERAARGGEQARAILGRGIQQIGGAVGGIGEDLYNKLVKDQYLKAKIDYESGTQKFFIDMENKEWVKDGIPQWQRAQEQFDIHQKGMMEKISNLLVPEARGTFQDYALQRKVIGDEVLDKKIGRIRNSYLLETLPLVMARNARSGDWEQAHEVLNELKKEIIATGTIPESQLLQFDKIFDKNVVIGAAKHGLADKAIQRMIKEADSLTEKEKAALNRTINEVKRYEVNQAEIALKKQQETEEGQIYDAIYGGLPEDFAGDMWDFVESKKSLDAGVQQSLWQLALKSENKYDIESHIKVEEAISDLREEKIIDGKEVDRAYVLKVLRDNGAGIDESTGKTLVPKIFNAASKDPEDPVNSPDVKRMLSALNELKTNNFFVTQDEIDEDPEKARVKNLSEWIRYSNDLERWLKKEENIDATPKQKREYYDLLLEKPIEEAAKSFLERPWNIFKHYPYWPIHRLYKYMTKEEKEVGAKELPEPMNLTEFEDTVRSLDEEDAKKYYEKWKSKW